MSGSQEGPSAQPAGLRSRRTAALTRVAVAFAGLLLSLSEPALSRSPALCASGFSLIALTSLVQLAAPRLAWQAVEETVSSTSGVLIIGLGSEHVTVLSILWMAAAASGVLARGGRQHWVGRAVLLASLALPPLRDGSLSGEYAAFCTATIALLLTAGRVTTELEQLLGQARRRADSAQTLLLAGDLASRLPGHGPAPEPSADRASSEELATASYALDLLVAGEGLSMLVQPIVDLGNGRIHAYECLARFEVPGVRGGPLHWFDLADTLDRRAELERACLSRALVLFAERPPGTSLTVNLSAAVLLEAATQRMLLQAAEREPDGLSGLIIEITEETLAEGELDVARGFGVLASHGACLAVDDMGAGYAGLRQITVVEPRYIKLDRSLITGIDRDSSRAELVRALTGYARQVGSLLIAEGVETPGELAAVRALGAPLVQGYVFARPSAPWPQLGTRVPEPAGEPRVHRGTGERAHAAGPLT